MTEVIIGVSIGVALAALGGVWAWVRWSGSTHLNMAVSRAVVETVNGRLDAIDQHLGEIDGRLREIEEWNKSHNRRHGHEQRQLLTALARQGIRLPDGWEGSV